MLGDGMKEFLVLVAFFGMVVTASAGGLAEPAMDPAVVEAETAGSGSDNWVGIMLTLLVIATAIAD